MNVRLKKTLKYSAVILTVLMLTVGAVLYYVLSTTSGMKYIISKVNSSLSDVLTITADIDEGSVLDGFKTDSYFEVNVKDVVIVRANSIDLKYHALGYLSTDVFKIDHLNADKLEVELVYNSDDSEESEDESEVEDDTPFRLDFLVKIAINSLKLKNFAYLSDIVDVRVPSADLVLEAHDDFAGITSGVIENPSVHLKYTGDDNPEPNNLPEILTFDNGNGAIEKITDIDLPLNAALYNLKIKQGRYYQDGYDTGLIDASVNALWEHTLLKVFSIRACHPLGEVSVSGTMDFVDYYNMNFVVSGVGYKTKYNLEHYESSLYGLTGEGTLKGDLVDLNLDANINTPKEVAVKARINTLSNEVPVYLSVKSDRVSFPLVDGEDLLKKAKTSLDNESVKNVVSSIESVETGLSSSINEEDLKKNQFSFNKLDFSLEGAIFKEMPVKLSTIFSGHGFKKVKLNLDSTLTTSDFNIHSFDMTGSLGERSVKGKIEGLFSFDKKVGFDGKVSFKADDAGDLSEFLRGGLDLDSQFRVFSDSDSKSVEVGVDHVNAKFNLNSHPSELVIKDFTGVSDTGFHVDTFAFKQKENNVYLTGNLSDSSFLDGTFELPDLSLIIPGSKGSFTGRLVVSGDAKAPKIALAGKSERFFVNNIFLSNFVFDSVVDLASEHINLSMIANSVMVSKYIKPYKKCSLDFSGDLPHHRLTLSCGSGGGSYVSAEGSFDEVKKLYSAKIMNMLVVSNVIDPISIKDPIQINYDLNSRKGHVSPVSISDGNSTLTSTEILFGPGLLKTVLDLDKMNLQFVNKYLPDEVKLAGRVSMHSDINVNNGIPNIKGYIKSENGMVAAYSSFMPFKLIHLNFDADARNLVADLNVELRKDLGTLNVSAAVSEPYSKKRLSGSVVLKDLNLDLFTATTKQLNMLEGRANINAKLDGTLAAPLIFGDINVNGKADPSLSIGEISKFDVHVKADGSKGTVKGVFTMNDSDLNLGGNLDWSESAKGKLQLDAVSLPFFLLTYGEAVADIHTLCELDEIIKVTGKVDIPRAMIKFKSLDNKSIAPSKDEIFVDSNTNLRGMMIDKKKAASINNDMLIDVEINLGDNVKVNAMGLRSNVVGGVKIHKSSDSNKVISSGKVSLEHARADMYGHKFIFNHAHANFKGDITNPALDVEVVADPSAIDDDVLAGVKVSGYAENPEITLFSKPAMSKNEILSYLLYGHGLERNASGNSDASSAQLLMSLGLGTTAGMLNSVVGIFGMDGVQLGSSGSGDETQVEVQTYVNNRLRLSYGYGIYNSVNEFKIRYELVRKLYAEFVSSIDQSVNLIYSFETN